MSKVKVIILAGPPGSGKGTQAHLLKKRLGFDILQMSQVIREKFKTDPDNPDVKESKKAYKEGRLTDGKVLARWAAQKINKMKDEVLKKGLILDGAARTLEETKATFRLFKEMFGADKLRLFFIKISPQETIRRNSKRVICQKCLKPINPDLVGKIKTCPHCGGKLGKREMDSAEVMKKRLQVYKKETLPAIQYLKEKGIVVEIDGEQPIEDVYKDIAASLEKE